MIIRNKEYEDIENFILLVNDVWNETYRGIVDDSFLDNMKNTVDERVKRSKENYDKKPKDTFLAVDDGRLIGYTSAEKSRDEDYPNSGEISSLYLRKEYQGKGLGKELFNYSLNKLKEQGFNDYIIGCLDGNPTNEFYKYMGGKYYKSEMKKIGDKEYKENYYYFKMR